MTNSICRLIGMLALVAGAAFAQPNLSGHWTLNTAASDFGEIPAPAKFVRDITQEGDTITYTTTQSGPAGDVTTHLSYQTDGVERTQTVNGAETTGSASWDGDVLVIKSVRGGQVKIESTERWTLSSNSQTLTIAADITLPSGSVKLRIVLDRQE